MFVPVLISAIGFLAAAAAPAPNPAPLRQVTYKVSVGTRGYTGGEHFGGYSSSSTATSDSGTVTVVITGVQGDALGMSVTEIMNKTGNPATFSGSVMPDGTVVFPPQSIQDVTRELLQYFGPQFISADKLTPDSSWDVAVDQTGVQVRTNYKVTKIDGPLITIAERQMVKVAAQSATISTIGSVTLKPSLLVPISGDLVRTVSRVTVSGDTKTETSLHFERVSDSRDTPAK